MYGIFWLRLMFAPRTREHVRVGATVRPTARKTADRAGGAPVRNGFTATSGRPRGASGLSTSGITGNSSLEHRIRGQVDDLSWYYCLHS
jgi:hypothetical protein